MDPITKLMRDAELLTALTDLNEKYECEWDIFLEDITHLIGRRARNINTSKRDYTYTYIDIEGHELFTEELTERDLSWPEKNHKQNVSND